MMQHTMYIKALGLVVSEKKMFSCFPYIAAYVKHVTSGWGYFWHQRHNLNKLGRGPLDDATYQILGSRPCGFRQQDLFTFSLYYKPML